MLSVKFYIRIRSEPELNQTERIGALAERILNQNLWSIRIKGHDITIDPVTYTSKEIKNKRKYATIKVFGLPEGTGANQLNDVMEYLNGKTCIIPRRRTQQNKWIPLKYAYIRVALEDSYIEEEHLELPDNTKLFFTKANTPICTICGDPAHNYQGCPLYGKPPVRKPRGINITKVINDIVTNIYNSSESYNPKIKSHQVPK